MTYRLLSATLTALIVLTSYSVIGQVKTQTHSQEQEQPIARALKDNSEKVFSISEDKNFSHWLTIKPVELKDNSGLVYLGGRISQAQVDKYLAQMKTHLGDDYDTFRQNQGARDHYSFHLTLINPYEYQTIDTSKLDLAKGIAVELLGLGRVSNDKHTAYYVVAHSPEGQYFRQQVKLGHKDFHVTLGFNQSDVYDRGKGRDTLLKN
ncbi:hypothetical protein LP316_13305 [Thalassotalea sp. LPB0316]|uniref:hypothetical protein n=1 Tax=Thalassotalea sp. LPB0316 TaxID=2769490 RepID=UPI0018671BFF|nr:hypothetical protein [Thalassotalea sp. LPB0316]QOL25261.1 hypothetical protein LP316_13305 [Thalassotalea sp. LPB0316]